MNIRLIICIMLYLLYLYSVAKNLIKKIICLNLVKKYRGYTTAKIIEVTDGSYYHTFFTKIGCYRPVYRYEVDGVAYEKESTWWFYRDKSMKGDVVGLHYDEENPERFVAGEWSEWRKSAVQNIILFAIYLALGIWVYIML